MKPDGIRVNVLVLPDGNTVWGEASKMTDNAIRKFLETWRSNLPKGKLELFESAKVTSGMVVIYMLREDYDKIPANNQMDFSMFSGSNQ